MKNTLTVGQIERSIQRFGDYSNDLIQSDMNTFEDRLNLFFSFFEQNETFSRIHNQLTSMPSVNFRQWLEERMATINGWAGGADLSFPTDLEQRLSIMYQLLYAFRSQSVQWQDFAMQFFVISSSRYDDYIAAINETVTQPLVRELLYRLEDIKETLPNENAASVSPSIVQIIHQATNVIQQNASGSNISQSASQTINPDLDILMSQLRDAIESSSIDEVAKTDAKQLIAAVENEAKSARPRFPVIKALLSALPPVDSILSISTSILDIVSRAN